MDFALEPGSVLAPADGAKGLLGSLVLGQASWTSLLCLGGVLVGLIWLAWNYWARIAQWLGLYRTVSESIELTDPHGLHMRRCKDLVELARRYVGYRIFVRCPTARIKTWANARSIISLQMLAVRGPAKGEKPPVLQVQVQGLRPKKVLQEIGQKLRLEPQKYLNAYELYEVAKETGGQLAIRPPKAKQHPLRAAINRIARRLAAWVQSPGNHEVSAATPPVAGEHDAQARAKPGTVVSPPRVASLAAERRPKQAGRAG